MPYTSMPVGNTADTTRLLPQHPSLLYTAVYIFMCFCIRLHVHTIIVYLCTPPSSAPHAALACSCLAASQTDHFQPAGLLDEVGVSFCSCSWEAAF